MLSSLLAVPETGVGEVERSAGEPGEATEKPDRFSVANDSIPQRLQVIDLLTPVSVPGTVRCTNGRETAARRTDSPTACHDSRSTRTRHTVAPYP